MSQSKMNGTIGFSEAKIMEFSAAGYEFRQFLKSEHLYTMGHDQDIGPEGEVFILKIYIDFMKLQIIKYLFP